MSQTPSLPFLVKAWSFNKNRLRHTLQTLNMFKANYKDARMILTEAVLVSFFRGLWIGFYFLRYFQKITLLKCPGISEDIKHNSFIVKQLFVLFIVKTRSIAKRDFCKSVILWRQPFPDAHEKVFFKNFLKLTGKYLYRNLYLIKLLASILQL